MFYFFRWELGDIDTNVLGAIFTWLAVQVALATFLGLSGLDGIVRIAFWAHVGGFSGGVLMGALFVRFGYVRRFKRQTARNPVFGYV